MKTTLKEVTLVLPSPSIPRSPGTHVSGIIRAIAMQTGILKAEGVDEPSMADLRVITDPVAIIRICIGLAWEEYYLGTFLKGVVKKHPGETCLDGVYMSPDGISREWIETPNKPYPGVMITRVHEVKATYKSINTVGDLSKEWLWLTQVKAYCKGLKTTHAKLHVLFICGDYKMPIRPMVKEWALEFTKQEVDSNWEMLREYRDWRE
jgi:hypothetical protein